MSVISCKGEENHTPGGTSSNLPPRHMKNSKTEDTRREVGADLVKSIADEEYRGWRDSSAGKMFAAQVRRH